MIRVRPGSTDEDLETWRRVWMAVHPSERAASVQAMRGIDSPTRLLVLAELDGEVVGSGLADASTFTGEGWVAVRVVPHARRRGVGSAVLGALGAHLNRLHVDDVVASLSDAGYLGFAARFGFQEVEREVRQARRVSRGEALPVLPAGVRIVSLADRPDLSKEVYTSVVVEAYADLAFDADVAMSFDEWQVAGVGLLEATFVALWGEEVVGCAGLDLDPDNPRRAEHSLTAVRRGWRGRGVALALKQMTLHWAAPPG
jgi:GNAT superfamily N-acetyltransferase